MVTGPEKVTGSPLIGETPVAAPTVRGPTMDHASTAVEVTSNSPPLSKMVPLKPISAPVPTSRSRIPPLPTVITLVLKPPPSALKLAWSMLTSTPALTVRLEVSPGMVKLAPAPMVALRLNTTSPLLTRSPPDWVKGASNWSVPSVSMTVMMPPVWVKAAPAMNEVSAAAGRKPPVLPLSTSTVAPASMLQAADMSRVELWNRFRSPL